MESYEIFKDLAIIVIFAKFFGIVARKLKAPQVVGEIVAGLLIGPSILGLVEQSDFLALMAEIGVVLLMFSAGLETNLKDLVKTGPAACLIACMGVAIPLVCGTILYMIFFDVSDIGSPEFFKAVFVGVIMTATSVSITVQALKEMGKLQGRLGTTIVSAAIIDDVIGIIVLTFVISYSQASGGAGKVILNTVLFFVFSFVAGIIIYKVFKKIDGRYPHTQRIPIIGLALCMTMAYCAEKFFGIADITGAFAAGVILCNSSDADYIDRKVNINSYMLFGPIFFASIGIKTDIEKVSMQLLFFSLLFVVVALIAKIIGCGFAAKMCKYNNKESLIVGVGMMTRGEVALIVAQKGLSCKLINSTYFTSVILLIIVSSILTPIILKLLFRGYSDDSNKEGIETDN